MSGFGGFGGFGQNNQQQQQQQQTGFGGFGSGNTTNTGFGSTNNTTGFGATNTGGGIFGNSGGQSSGFGGSGGFGSAGAFGAKPAFGAPAATSGGSLFGSGTATAGSSGFGGFGQPAQTTSAFGGGATGSSIFGGANKTGFGTTTGTGAFGSPAATSGFGGSTTSAFGAPQSTALGGATADCQGTGNVPFQAFVEKEPNSASNQQNSFQSISFQQPYQKFSPEELRLADYTQGRRFGNQSNQPGAFGTSTGFGSFGATTQPAASGFGTQPTSTNIFGGSGGAFGSTSQPQTAGFGTNTATSGGLFGAKPAGSSLFGSTPSAQPSTGLFGGTGSTAFGGSAAFGAQPSTANSLFGGQNNNPPKPGFSFQPAASTGTTFGTTPAAAGGFGGGLFGNNTQPTTNSSPFGQSQQAQPTTNAFGGGAFGGGAPTGSSLFGGPKPAATTGGLFSGQNTTSTGGGGLFGGGATQPATNNNPFGGTNTQTGGGIFGGAKPATTGLFGGGQQQNNTAGTSNLFGGFGNPQTQQPQQQSTGLFGSLGNNQPKPSLFGAQPQQQQTGSSLFGGNSVTQQGGLFGPTNTNQQQPQNSMFGGSSLFGGPQQSQQPSQTLTASINDRGAFGHSALFVNLQTTAYSNPGPLATPLKGSAQKKAAALPIYKLNPASSSRFSTPAKRGFGFSYSTYGSPNSASSTSSTPGASLNSSLLGGSMGRGLSKSMSTSSLRRTFNTDDSILAPGAFSSSPSARHFGSTGSIKKLVINRNLRGDLFSPPTKQTQDPPTTPSAGSGSSILKPTKRVSFGEGGSVSGQVNGILSPLKQIRNNPTPTSEELGLLRPHVSINGTKPTGTENERPEMEQVKNNELAIVPEEEAAAPQSKPAQRASTEDQELGDYWMLPTKVEIEAMPKRERKIKDFTVGRDGAGKVTFNAEVDLSKFNLDDICGGIVVLVVRSCTVYPQAGQKPPMGQGLNVPSTITLENSYPRGRESRGDNGALKLKKHIARLQKVPNTHFLNYREATGEWIFKVDHFTTYGLDYDDEDENGDRMSEFGQSTLSALPETPTPDSRTPKRNYDESFESSLDVTQTDSDPEDTFDFKHRKKAVVPGAFGGEAVYEDDEGMEDQDDEQDERSFLDERSVGSQSDDGVGEEPMEEDTFPDDESVGIVDHEMAGSYPQVDNTAEHEDDSQYDEGMDIVEGTPGGAMRARMRALKVSATPSKRKFTAGNNWTSTLQTTISPQKQDRALLKTLLDSQGNDTGIDDASAPAPRSRVVSDGRGFATSIDLMNSLFGQVRSPTKVAKVPAQPRGFQWQMQKRPKTTDGSSMADMGDTDRAFHDSMKPTWGPDRTLVFAAPSISTPLGRPSEQPEKDGILTIQKGFVLSESRDILFAKFSNEASATKLEKHMNMAVIDDSDGVPFAALPATFAYANFMDDAKPQINPAKHENDVWELASVLWDDITVPAEWLQVPNIEQRIRKDNLSLFWEKLVDSTSTTRAALVRAPEEKAIAALSGHRVEEACGYLLDGKDYHLATLVAQIGGKESARKDIREQLHEWKQSEVLAEFGQPIRAIYELLAGNVCICDGTKGGVAPEHRIESFAISLRFDLNWQQAFGLRLWYGTLVRDELAEAVNKFAHDISQNLEPRWPSPWYVLEKIEPIWKDEHIDDREDLLWGLLRIFVFDDTNIEAVISPENSQLSPLDYRLSWQLSLALSKVNPGPNHISEEAADQVTEAFASQLTSEGSWLEAVFVLLHLKSPDVRAQAIQDHLARHAPHIGAEDSKNFIELTQTFKIPVSWVWEAKALYLRSVKKDRRAEVDFLIKAGAFEEAHRTFAKEVAPKTIVERDYETLRTLLVGFQGMELSIPEWHLGGEIYSDFLQLLDSQKSATGPDASVLQRLLASLPAVVQESRHAAFMETVAMEEISGIVAKAVTAAGKKGEKAKILNLPLTEDKYLKHTVELSLGYYRDVMAGGR